MKIDSATLEFWRSELPYLKEALEVNDEESAEMWVERFERLILRIQELESLAGE